MSKKSKGFTLVELVIVIAVIGILAAVLIPSFVSVINDANETAAQVEGEKLRAQIIKKYLDFDAFCTKYESEKAECLKGNMLTIGEIVIELFSENEKDSIKVNSDSEKKELIYRTKTDYRVTITANEVVVEKGKELE